MGVQNARKSGINRLGHVVVYIKENIRENLSLEELASQACLSKAHFLRTFKCELGMTPMEYILKERLKLARNYLLIGGIQIQEVAAMAGFNNPTYFIRAFKAEFGCTPKVFQKQ